MKNSIIFLVVLLVGIACQDQKVDAGLEVVQGYVVNHLQACVEHLDQLKVSDTKEKRIEAFRQARLAFKMAEPFSASTVSENTLRVNGPPLPIFREDNGKVLPPIGLQAIEETVFEDEIDSIVFIGQIEVTKGYLSNLIKNASKLEVTPRRFFVPIHQQFLRIFSLGLTGFDTPTSLFGLDESVACLNGIKEVYSMSIADTIRSIDPTLHESFIENLTKASSYITINNDFETFNRYEFGRDFLNPLTKDWVAIRRTFGYHDPKLQALNLDAPTFFEENSFHINFFRSTYNRNPSDKQIVLGAKLFHDARLSTSGNLSCNSCHKPDLAYQDGLRKGLDKNGKELKRNTPSIINTIYQKKFFLDGRSDNLEQQITNVFDNEDEFDSDAHAINSSTVLTDTSYKKAFAEAFPGQPFDRTRIVRAISSYTSTLNAMNSRFDRNMRGELDDFSNQEILGMNLYMGKALCATCHFIPLTNGTVPPLFKETEKEILGVPKEADNRELDPDEGFYWVFEADIHKYMFKTPTVRNSELTAPYMHNGVYESLDQVMDFYNKGGGGGLGFELPHQTLPFDSLNLNQEELDALVAFMKTFTDTNLESY